MNDTILQTELLLELPLFEILQCSRLCVSTILDLGPIIHFEKGLCPPFSTKVLSNRKYVFIHSGRKNILVLQSKMQRQRGKASHSKQITVCPDEDFSELGQRTCYASRQKCSSDTNSNRIVALLPAATSTKVAL